MSETEEYEICCEYCEEVECDDCVTEFLASGMFLNEVIYEG